MSNLSGYLNDELAESQGHQEESNVARPSFQRMITRNLQFHILDVTLPGAGTLGSDNLMHYPSFSRGGITTAAHSFFYIQAEEELDYLGYVEDIFVNTKNTKCVRVRWFLLGREVEVKNPELNPHPREVLLTNHVAVIRADCVNGPITVLTPQDYDKSSTVSSGIMSPRIYICFRQLINEQIMSFSVDKLAGYSNQQVVSSLESLILSLGRPLHYKPSGEEGEGSFEPSMVNIKLSDTGIAVCKPTSNSNVEINQKIELLCQDSGIRGCWFRCQVLQFHALKKLVEVNYFDVLDVDNLSNLKEWVPNPRVAKPHPLQMRCAGRLTIRPFPPESSSIFLIEVGTALDVWWCDGWWETVVTKVDSCNRETVEVYFPAEVKLLLLSVKNVRISRDWVDNKWVCIKPKPDILNCIDYGSLKRRLLRSTVAVEMPRIE